MKKLKKLYYRTNKYSYSFQNFRTINTFGRNINDGTVTLREADKDQNGLLVGILNFRKQVKPKNTEKKQRKEDVLENL